MERIGFIGVGSIGAAMAGCLVRAGLKMMICDKNPKALESFTNLGASVTDRPEDCADREMVIVMVANDSQVNEVLLGGDGLLNAVHPDRAPLLAIMSTVLPQTIQGIAPHCAKKNIRLVDAAVSGLPVVAEQGKLTIMVGGDKADLEAMKPVLKFMGDNIFHTGPLGSGVVTKLVNNIVGVPNLFMSVEAMLVGKKYGLDPSQLASIMETSSGRNFSTKDWERGRKTFEFFSQSLELSKVLVDLCRKDLEHAQAMARQVNLECPLLDCIVEAVRKFSYEEIQKRWHSVT
jgi:3-hydroxyisobutyrate dehydrogenase-like beta-hydroxyacid dehydrogenase